MASTGNISSPQQSLTTVAQCDWIISVPEGFRVRLKFLTFNLSPRTNERCLNGYVEIGGYDIDGSRVVHEGHLCGTTPPEDYISLDNRCWVYFFRGFPIIENETSFFISFDAVQSSNVEDSSNRMGLIALLIILVPIICSVLTYCCLKKRRVTKMELDYYDRFRSKHYPSMKSTRRHGGDIQIRVSEPPPEDYNDEDISIISNSFNYDMLPDKRYNVYRVTRPSSSHDPRSSAGSVFLHNTPHQGNMTGQASTLSRQYLNIPDHRGSYLSFRPPLNSETSRMFNSHCSTDTFKSPLTSQNLQGMINAASGSYDQDFPVIYVQNPDKFEGNANRNSTDIGTASGCSTLGIPLFRCQDQTHSNSVLENESQMNYIRKFKERSKSLTLPSKCFMVPKLEVRNRLMSEQHLPYVMESQWGENSKFCNNVMLRDDIGHYAGKSSSYREKGYSRKPSVSRRPQLEALPEIDHSESISSAENQIFQEIYTAVPENDIYGLNEQNCLEENQDKLPKQNLTLLRKVHNIEHQNLSACSQESENMTEHMKSNSDTGSSFCNNSLLDLEKNQEENLRLKSAQSEVMLGKYGKNQVVKSLSFQENWPNQTLDQYKVTDNLPKNSCNKQRGKHNVIQVDERNASLNMLRNYDMPDTVFDDTHHQQNGYKEKDIQGLLSEETCTREPSSPSEFYQRSGSISYIVPKIRTSASKAPVSNQQNNYNVASDSINSMHLLPNKSQASLHISDEVKSKVYQSFYEDPINPYQVDPRNKVTDNTFMVSEKKNDARRSNSYTHGRRLNIQVQDLMDNTSYVSNALPRYTAGAPEANRQNVYGCSQTGDRNNVYSVPCMSRSFSQPQIVDTKNFSYMFEMTRNTSYLHELNFSTSYLPESNQTYDRRYDTYQGRHESRYSVSVDINNNTDDNPSIMYRDLFPDQTGMIVLEEGESMV